MTSSLESAPASGHHDPAGASPEKVDPSNITYRCEKIPGERTSPGKKAPLPIPQTSFQRTPIMFNKTDEPNTLPLLVVFLRFYARMTQAELGEAAGVEQGLISKYEAGHQQPPEESLRRMARAVGIPWLLVTYLRRVYSALIRLARLRAIGKDLILDSLEELLDRMLVALAPYMIELVADLISEEEEDPEEMRLE